jgi:hypothetical protein
VGTVLLEVHVGLCAGRGRSSADRVWHSGRRDGVPVRAAGQVDGDGVRAIVAAVGVGASGVALVAAVERTSDALELGFAAALEN